VDNKNSGEVLPNSGLSGGYITTFCVILGRYFFMCVSIYTVNTDYIEFLRSVDSRVLENEKNFGNLRKYVGVLFKINNYDYFVPLSSPKPSDYVYMDGFKTIRHSVVPIYRIIETSEDKINFLGKLKFSSMIPAPPSQLTLLDITSLTEDYKTLIFNQIRHIRKKLTVLQNRHAKVIYNQKKANYANINYLNDTVDFKKLEQAMELFIKKDIITDKKLSLTETAAASADMNENNGQSSQSFNPQD